jgi:hypothetical protein
MGDLKSFWPDKDQAFSGTETSGAGVVSSGSDPNADGGDGPGGLKSFWDEKRALPENANPGNAESNNSVSGLPALPNRFEPAESTADIPDLTDRSPGTIDKQ